MNKGRIEQIGTPQELYRTPQTRFVAGFIGSPTMNFIACSLERVDDVLTLCIDGGVRMPVPADRIERYSPYADKPMLLGLRPEHLTEVRLPLRADMSMVEVEADVVEPLGMETMVFFRFGASQVCARLEPSAAPGPGERVQLMAHLSHMHLIDPQTDTVV
jgi:multiple sugar transport system ATP-binding protein